MDPIESPLKYFKTSESYSFRIACNLRGWHWMNYSLGDKFVKLSQNPRLAANKKYKTFSTDVDIYIHSN